MPFERGRVLQAAAALSWLLFAAPESLVGQKAFLVADISVQARNLGSRPQELVRVGGWVYFVAADDLHGGELWRTDGTEEGTSLVADLCPGPCHSSPSQLLPVGDHLYFLASDGIAESVWRADVGEQSVSLIAASGQIPGLNPLGRFATREITRTQLASLAGRVYFDVADYSFEFGYSSGELWSAEGGTEASPRVAEFCPGCSASELVRFGNYFYLRKGRILWRTDGTVDGTAVFSEDFDFPRSFLVYGNRLYFVASDQVWATDGSRQGTVALTKSAGEDPFITPAGLGERLYYLVGHSGGKTPFKTDGTEASLANEIEVTPPRRLDSLHAAADLLYVTVANTALRHAEWELWAYRAGNTRMRRLTSRLERVSIVASAKDRILFRVGSKGELWVSDGTPNGTQPLPDLRHLCGSRCPPRMAETPDGERLVFHVDDGSVGEELWVTDGTVSGTALLSDLRPSIESSSPGNFLPVGNQFYFGANDGDSAVWRSDSAATSVRRIVDAHFGSPRVAGETLFFWSGPLWRMNSERNGAFPLPGPRALGSPAVLNDVVYFAPYNTVGQQIWRSDGTVAGTYQMIDLLPGYYPGCDPYDPMQCPQPVFPSDFKSAGPWLFFVARGPRGVLELWRSDGTADGTVGIQDLGRTSSVRGAAAFNGVLMFSTYGPQEETAFLWRTDEDHPSVSLVKDLLPGESMDAPWALTPAEGFFYLLAEHRTGIHHTAGGRDYRTGDHQLWRSDGTSEGTYPLSRLATGEGRSFVRETELVGNKLFLSVWNAETGEELWVSDGSAEGTRLAVDLRPGPIGSHPASLAAIDDRWLAFAASDGVSGHELWASDGTATGTFLVEDLLPGPAASGPMELTLVGSTLFFSADDGVHGRELFATRLDEVVPGLCPDHLLCPGDGRFSVEVEWKDFQGRTGRGRRVPLTSRDSGVFRFFSEHNWEMLVKVLDGCPINNRVWVFSAATTTVEYTLRVTDHRSGEVREYFNPLGRPARALTDTNAFSGCPFGPRQGTAAVEQSPEESERELGMDTAISVSAAECGGEASLCLHDDRFRVEVEWDDGRGGKGVAHAAPPRSSDSGLLWFFNANNWEMLVKVLDGCSINGSYWVLAATASDVEYLLRVTDTESGLVSEYRHPGGTAAPTLVDVRAFPNCSS